MGNKERERERASSQATAPIRTVGSTEWLAGPPTVGTMAVLVPTHIPGLKGNTPAGKPDDAIGYAAEGAGIFGAQYDPANFPLSKELMLLGLSEQAWADILTSLRVGKGKTGLGFGFSKAIARANKDHFERIGALAAYAEYGKGQKAMVVLPLSEAGTSRVWVPDDQLREITSPVSKFRRKGKRICIGPQPGQPCAI